MRIAVIGAGGVGGYFGGRLAQAGHDVTFVARGAHLAALRERGLVIESGLGDVTIRTATFTDDVARIAPCDVVMLCVKLWDVESAAAAGRAAGRARRGRGSVPERRRRARHRRAARSGRRACWAASRTSRRRSASRASSRTPARWRGSSWARSPAATLRQQRHSARVRAGGRRRRARGRHPARAVGEVLLPVRDVGLHGRGARARRRRARRPGPARGVRGGAHGSVDGRPRARRAARRRLPGEADRVSRQPAGARCARRC